jgi:hypothetical protein
LYTEIVHAMQFGVKTTSRKDLDFIYRKYDKEFSEAESVWESLSFAFDIVSGMTYLKGSALAKPYQIYSLSLALVHYKRPIPGLAGTPIGTIAPERLEVNLLALADAIDRGREGSNSSEYAKFVSASSEKTNVKMERETRIRYYIDAAAASYER